MENGNDNSQQEIFLYSEEGNRIETKLIWDFVFKPRTEFVITKGFGTSLFMMTWDEWDLFEDMIKSLPMDSPDMRILGRFFIAGAIDIAIDDQLGIMIPSYLLKHAGINNKAIIKGKAGFAQIISAENSESIDCIGGVEELRARLMYQAALIDVGRL